MALVVNDVSNYSLGKTEYNSTVKGKTTITPFSTYLEKEKTNQVKKTEMPSETPSQTQVNTSNVSSTNGTSGTLSQNGTLTTTLKDIFQRASEKYNISYDFLVAVAKAESDFNPKCVSSAGAKGIMQIMPYEAKELGITDVYDAEQNIMGAAKLLKAHLKKFDGDTTLAAAAYNAGSGRVKQYGGVPPFTETQNYVKKIASYMKQGVDVPNKKVTVTPNKLSGDVTVSQASKSASTTNATNTANVTNAANNLNAVAATEEEMNKSMVVVGSGERAVTMTYGAYQKYLELGNLGVG